MFNKFFAVIFSLYLVFGNQNLIESKSGSSGGSRSYSSPRSGGFSKSPSWGSRPSSQKPATKPNTASSNNWGSNSQKPLNVNNKPVSNKPKAFNSNSPNKNWGTNKGSSNAERNNNSLFRQSVIGGHSVYSASDAISRFKKDKPVSQIGYINTDNRSNSNNSNSRTFANTPNYTYANNDSMLPYYFFATSLAFDNEEKKQRSIDYINNSRLEDIENKRNEYKGVFLILILFFVILIFVFWGIFRKIKTY